MDNESLAFSLLRKAQEKGLPPFCLIEGHPHLPPEELDRWMDRLLRGLSPDSVCARDTLTLEGDKPYTTAQIDSIVREFEFQSFTGRPRYFVIRDAGLCGPIVFNKLLKTLEAPPENSSIFLLNPKGAPILPTVKSRAVTFRLRSSQKTPVPGPQTSFPHFLRERDEDLAHLWNEDLSLVEFCRRIGQDGKAPLFFRRALGWCRGHLKTFEECRDFERIVRFLEEQESLNGPVQTRLALLIPFIYRLSQKEGHEQRAVH